MKSSYDKQVLVFAGGGLSHVSGGVGTLMRYLIAAWNRDPAALPVRVIDTRGAGGLASAAAQFARSAAALAAGRLSGRTACAHFHMTTRGSALRKSLLCLLARALGTPVILHLHGADFFDFYERLPVWAARALRAALLNARCIIVMGEKWRARLIDEVGVPAGKIRIVPNGVPAAPAARSPASEGVACPVRLLFLGRLGARKGVADLIAALATPALRERAWHATIAGDGDRSPYLDQIAAAGTSDRITMPGWLGAHETAAALDRADILVLPSHHEVMPIAILEAMARGLAIVATPVGVIPEILRDGENARLIAPGVPDELAGALVALIDDPGARAAIGRQARVDFAARLDIRIPAASLQAIYRQAILPGRHARQPCTVPA